MPGVKGTFEVDNRASAPLREMRADAASTKQAFRDLGQELDRVGANTSNLDRYKRAISDMGDTGVRSLGELSNSWDRTAASTDKSIEAMKGGMDSLQVKMKEVSDTRMTPTVDLRGLDETLAKLELLEAKLKEVNRQSARPSVGARSGFGGFGSGGSSTASAAAFVGPISSAASDAEGLGSAIPSLAIKAAAALPVIESLVGATTALVSSMSGAAVGAGAVGLAGGGALAVGLSSIMAVAKPALTSIENVFKAETSLLSARQQSSMPGMQQTQQLRQVIQAENQLQQAQVQSRQAQLALTEARRQARNSLVNLGTAAQSAALGEKQAALTLAQSQRSLYEAQTSPTSTPLQIQQAELAVQQARLGITTSKQQDKEAVEALRIGRAQGVNNNPQVVSAQNSAQQATLAIRNARWAEEEARKSASGGGSSVEQARLAYQQALAHAPAGTKELIEAGRDFIKEWKGATAGASHDFVAILSGTVGTARAMLPTLSGASNRDMHALRGAGEDFDSWLRSPANQAFITTGSKMFAENLGNGEQAVTHIFTTLENITEAARPFLHEATTDFDHWTGSWAKGTDNISKTRAEIGHMVDDARAWTRMWEEGWRLLDDIMHAGRASDQGNNMLEDFTKTMDRWDEWVKENPEKVRSFFRQTVEGAEALGHAIGGIAHSLTELATQLQPLMRGGLGLLGALNSTGLTSSVGGLGGLYGLYRGARMGLSGAGGGGGRIGGGAGVMAMAGGGSAAAGRMVMTPGGALARGPVGQWLAAPSYSMIPGAGGVRQVPQEEALLFGMLGGKMGGAAVSAEGLATPEAFTAKYGSIEGARYAMPEGLSATKGMAGLAARIEASGMGSVLKGGLGAAASKVGRVAGAGARIAAPYLALNDVLSIAGGQNPFKGSSPVSGVLGGAAQGAVMGAGLGSVVPVLGTGVGAVLGGAAGTIAGVASNAGALHRDIFGASSSEKAVEGYEALAKQIQAVGGRLNELNPKQLEKLNTEATKLQKQGSPALKGVSLELQEIIGATNKSAQASSRWSHEYSGSVQAMASASHRSLGEVADVANTTAEGIKQELGGGSAKAKEMLARNFGAAAEIVDQRMTETGQFTREGVAIVNRELDRALGEYGLHVPKGVSTTQKEEVLKARGSGDKTAGFGAGGAVQDLTPAALAKQEGRATGGRLPGMGSYDTVRMGDGGYGAPGELVVNRHTEMAANMGLARAGMPSLGAMVGMQTIPHSTPMRATGGRLSHYDRLVEAANMVSARNFPYRWGGGHEQPAHLEPFDCSGSVSYAVQHAGYNVPTTVAQNIGSWGFPAGEGQATIFYKGGPEAHTFMRIGGKYWGTSGFARPGGGAGWFDQTPASGYLSGFNKVHLPGLGSDSVSIMGGPGSINLNAPSISGVGVPGAFANAGVAAYATGLSGKLNEALAASSTAAKGGVTGGSAGTGDPLLDSLLPSAGGQRVGASYYGGPSDPSSGVTGYRGDNLMQHPDSYAELNMGHALGGLPYLTPLRVSYGGKSAILKKRDIGAGGGPVDGVPRAIDLWYEAADALGLESAGLGVVDVQRMATGGRLGGVPYIGGFARGGSFRTRPGKPVSFVAGEGAHTEDVQITPRSHSATATGDAGLPTIHVEINVGDVTCADAADFKRLLGEASDEAARKLLAAFRRRADRKVAGTVAD
jgi:hypothetical protein